MMKTFIGLSFMLETWDTTIVFKDRSFSTGKIEKIPIFRKIAAEMGIWANY
jgi:hypothetical protein